MGAFWINSIEIAGHLGELVGYKAGLALTRDEIAEHLVDSPHFQEIVLVEDDRWVHVRSEEYDEAVTGLLYQVGNIPTPNPLPPIATVTNRFKDDPLHSKVLDEVLDRCIDLLGEQLRNKPQETPLDPVPILETIATEFGLPGINIAYALCERLYLQVQISPWSSQRSVNWVDTVQLLDLFKSESLETQYGTFFDQRYVDYLAHNFQRIDDINWRQFEGLTAEHFQRSGFQVDIGPGRGDGGIDVRVWAAEDDTTKPPVILVQCKREREKVAQVVVKALWADVLAERAESGLIVTTTALAPSAHNVRKARNYKIDAVERGTLKEWIEQLRSPGSGTFLA